MRNEEDITFETLKNRKYRLQITLLPSNDEELEQIIEGLRTTLEEEPTILPNGDQIYYSLTLDQLSAELFCLGAAFANIERDTGIVCPFDYSVDSN